jgi:hypothetical protein
MGKRIYLCGIFITPQSVMEMRANVGNIGIDLQSSSLGKVDCIRMLMGGVKLTKNSFIYIIG